MREVTRAGTATPPGPRGPAAPAGLRVALVATVVLLAALLAAPVAAASPAPAQAPVPPPPDLGELAALDPTPHPLPGVAPRVRCVAPAAPDRPATVIDAPWAQRRLRFTDAWRFTRGAGQTVAVIDTGVSRHPRLAGRLIDGGDFVGDQGGLADCDGHGTLVAGIIAAAPDPTTGFVGVAPDARVVSVRQSSATVTASAPDGTRTTGGGTVTTLAESIVRAVRLGAGVINISEAACVPAGSAATTLAPLRAAVHYAATADRVVVAAAGNAGSGDCRQSGPGAASDQVVAPAWFSDEVLSVGYTRRDGLPAPPSIRGPWVSLSAPGADIVSLDPTGPGVVDRIAPTASSTAVPVEGTSFAAPYVSGVVALVRARYPGLSARQVRDRVIATATHPAGTGGRDDAVGAGTVDPVAALADVRATEFGAGPVGVAAGRVDLRDTGHAHSDARTVALIGSVGAVVLLGGVGLAVGIARRGRRSRRVDER